MKYRTIGSRVQLYQWLVAIVSMLLGFAAVPTTSFAGVGDLTITAPNADTVDGGEILPPSAKPFGYSLSDMAAKNALFATSGNTDLPNYPGYPTTPFQILYYAPDTYNVNVTKDKDAFITGNNSFSKVHPGTMFYVPFAYVDDSTPILGTFPTSPARR